MKILAFLFAEACFILLLFMLPHSDAALKYDKRALLAFASLVPHSNKLNWDSSTAVCSSWVGITCNVSRVVAVRLPGFGLYGPVPANTLGKVDSLTILSLRSNMLNGTLPSDLLSLPLLHNVNLKNNDFSGAIPSNLSPQLNTLDLSFNSFSGNIPATIQNLTQLTMLNLENNSLTGPIPENILGLKQLNLSYNHLNGSIPMTLRKFPASSFEGNTMLCGQPLNQCSTSSPLPSPSPSSIPSASPSPLPSLPPHPEISQPPSAAVLQKQEGGSKKRMNRGSVVAIAFVSVAALLCLVLTATTLCFKRKDGKSDVIESKAVSGKSPEVPKEPFSTSGVQETEKNNLVFFEGRAHAFDLEDLLQASAEVLGKGSYGMTYKVVLEDGTCVAVKRLRDVIVGKREFEQQMENVGRIGQHPNAVPLRAYYHSKDEKLLVFDYLAAGSLSTLLHGRRDVAPVPLDLESRVKICLGAAKGLTQIHTACGGKLVHGNVKSSNVLITQDLNGSISDFGLVPLLNYPSVPPRSSGYRAPEVRDTRKPTQKSDVYSYGVLLLEMLTGKSPTQVPGNGEPVDLPEWVQSVVREEWTAEVFDTDLMRSGGANTEEEMVQMLQVALACVAMAPDMRPTMDQVVKMIQQIRPSDSRTHAPPPPPSSENKDSHAQHH